jgi:hypothetical protein
MVLSLADFTSLFELGAGLILASGIAQVLYQRNSTIIQELIADIYRLRDVLNLEITQGDAVDQRLEGLEMEYIKKKDEVGEIARGFVLGNFSGILVPIVVLYQAPQSGDVGIGLITALAVLTIAWGPAWILFSFLVIRHEMSPVIDMARKLKHDILKGKVAGS